VKFLIAYLFLALILGLRAGAPGRKLSTRPLLIGAFVLAVGYLSQRVINS
jgi:hypothetical protein